MGAYPEKNGEAGMGLQHLDAEQVKMIDEALGMVGDFGVVHLKVEKGRLRFLCVEQSFDALKWKPLQGGRLRIEG